MRSRFRQLSIPRITDAQPGGNLRDRLAGVDRSERTSAELGGVLQLRHGHDKSSPARSHRGTYSVFTIAGNF